MNQLQFKDGSRVEISEFKYANAYLQVCLYSPIETVKELFYNTNNLDTLEFYTDDRFVGTYSGYLNVRNITLDNRLNADLEPVDYCTVVLYQPLIKDRINTLESTLVQETNALNTKTSTIETKVIELDAAINPVADTESMTLEESKIYQKSLIAKSCEDAIYEGIEYKEADGTISTYTYKPEDQLNFNDMMSQMGLLVQFPYHPSGGSCRMYSAAEITAIYNLECVNKTKHLTKCNQLYLWIEEMTSKDEVLMVTFYSPLPDKFQQVYDEIIYAVEASMQTALSTS